VDRARPAASGPARPGPDVREKRIDLTKRAGQKRGWSTGTFVLYGKEQAKRYKTFVATWRPAGGAIRVDDPTGYRGDEDVPRGAYFNSTS
jgi:hypothetical protein